MEYSKLGNTDIEYQDRLFMEECISKERIRQQIRLQ